MVGRAAHGRGFTHAQRSGAICADVLDAWFDPSPKAIEAFRSDPLSMRSSPDLEYRDLILAISRSRNLDSHCISLGAGSSEIIHRVLPSLVQGGTAVLLDPTYSEYAHVLNRARCPIRRFELRAERDFQVDLSTLIPACQDASLVVLVNPNNPTGQSLRRQEVLALKKSLKPSTNLWVDEAYVDYSEDETSVERDACVMDGLYVVKSLSKAYALSGVRAAYLVSGSEIVPPAPWIIGSCAERAVTAATEDSSYYSGRWKESRRGVRDFAEKVRNLGLGVYAGSINAILVEVPHRRTATEWAESLAHHGLIVRTPTGMGNVLGDRYIRIGLVRETDRPDVIKIIKACTQGP